MSSHGITLARRIVTGDDENGKAKVLYDDTSSGVKPFGNGNGFQVIWSTDSVPVENSSATAVDPTQGELAVVTNGSVASIVSFQPGTDSPMHLTRSIDYGIVLEGEIELELSGGDKRLMKKGDVIVQRGTHHAWHNRHPTESAKIFFVLVATNEQGPRFQLAD